MADNKNDGGMRVDVELVRQLATLLDETNLTEIEVEDNDRRIRVAREVHAAAPISYAAPPAVAAPAAAPVASAPAAESAPPPPISSSLVA